MVVFLVRNDINRNSSTLMWKSITFGTGYIDDILSLEAKR